MLYSVILIVALVIIAIILIVPLGRRTRTVNTRDPMPSRAELPTATNQLESGLVLEGVDVADAISQDKRSVLQEMGFSPDLADQELVELITMNMILKRRVITGYDYHPFGDGRSILIANRDHGSVAITQTLNGERHTITIKPRYAVRVFTYKPAEDYVLSNELHHPQDVPDRYYGVAHGNMKAASPIQNLAMVGAVVGLKVHVLPYRLHQHHTNHDNPINDLAYMVKAESLPRPLNNPQIATEHTDKDGIWISMDGRPVLTPNAQINGMARMDHDRLTFLESD